MGQKDLSKGAFSVWTQLLSNRASRSPFHMSANILLDLLNCALPICCLQTARIDSDEHVLQGQVRAKATDESERLFRMLGDFGDYELVLSGVHENMLSQRYLDTHMERTCSILSHLQAADQLMTATHKTMDFAFMAYLPATMLGIRAVVAGPDRLARLA